MLSPGLLTYKMGYQRLLPGGRESVRVTLKHLAQCLVPGTCSANISHYYYHLAGQTRQPRDQEEGSFVCS